MGLGIKLLNPRNIMQMRNMVKISSGMDLHMKKRCAYCDLDLGYGKEAPLVEFLAHLEKKHPEKIMPNEIEIYKKIIVGLTR